MTSLGMPAGTSVRSQSQPTGPWTYLNLALFAFALLGFEIVLVLVEPLFAFTQESIQAAILHWVLTIVVWTGGAAVLATWVRSHTDFALRDALRPMPDARRWLSIAALVVAVVAVQVVLRGGVLPATADYAALSERFGCGFAMLAFPGAASRFPSLGGSFIS